LLAKLTYKRAGSTGVVGTRPGPGRPWVTARPAPRGRVRVPELRPGPAGVRATDRTAQVPACATAIRIEECRVRTLADRTCRVRTLADGTFRHPWMAKGPRRVVRGSALLGRRLEIRSYSSVTGSHSIRWRSAREGIEGGPAACSPTLSTPENAGAKRACIAAEGPRVTTTA
jgi:hypothetical protein